MSTGKDDKQSNNAESFGGTVAGRAATVVDYKSEAASPAQTPTRKRSKGRVLRTIKTMNPEPLVKAIIDLAQAQLKLGALMTRALLGLQDGPANIPDRPASTDAAMMTRSSGRRLQFNARC